MLFGIRHLGLWIVAVALLAGCWRQGTVCEVADTVATDRRLSDTRVEELPQLTEVCYTDMEKRLLEWGLVDVQVLDPTIQVHLVYASKENFVGRVLYSDLHRALLLPEMAAKVVAAQEALRRERPDLSLLVLDAVRPLSVQYQMFHIVAGTPQNRYVANPKHGAGMHNYGAAVDVTLVDTAGNWLPMGSEFDHFGVESHIDNESQLVATGKITRQELQNRQLLRHVMRQQGLLTLGSEWWHFNLMTKEKARRSLRVIDL